ncbi:MAG: hypothetical protein AB7O49_14405 [Sphingomonadales bacterium]
MRRIGFCAVLLAAAASGMADRAGAEVYPETMQGRHLAEQHCVACHAVGIAEDSTWNDRYPTLLSLAPRIAADPYRYHLFLTNPHREMVGVSLDRDQIDAVFAYVLSLINAAPSPGRAD